MYDQLLNNFKKKKKEKYYFNIFSFYNNQIFNIEKNSNIDILRFDLNEFAEIYEYNNSLKIKKECFINNLKSINKINDKLVAIDVPISEIYFNNNYSIDKIINFFNETNADLLVLNVDYNILELVNKLSKIKIPSIIYANCDENLKNNIEYLKNLENSLLDSESMGSVMIILENFEKSFIENIKKSLSIPVIGNDKKINLDGFYGKFSHIFGLIDNNNKKYLNLYDIISASLNDCINDEN